MKARHLCLITVIAGLVAPVESLAGVTVGVNNLSVVHKNSNGVTIAFPDVCKTPAPAGPIPIPYPNIAQSRDTAKGTKPTKISPLESPVNITRQPEQFSGKTDHKDDDAVYSLKTTTEGTLLIRQSAGRDSVTTATYVDAKGKRMPLREHALIRLANDDLCAICAGNDGKVTAVYRLPAASPRRKTP